MNSIDKLMRWIFSLIGKKPNVHLYALCWNDEKMLPHFFNHYNEIVDTYFIFDNGSTDRSLELIQSNEKAVLGTFDVIGNSFVGAAQEFYNKIWKTSRGKADWVIICNIDEFFYHQEGFQNYLKKSYYEGYTIIQPEGYEMIAEYFPYDDSQKIYETVRFGLRASWMDKAQVFNPSKIREINFAPGRHSNGAEGEIKIRSGACKLLHFKYVGMEYWLPRQNELRQGLKELDIENKWGEQYIWEDQEKIRVFNEYREKAVKVL